MSPAMWVGAQYLDDTDNVENVVAFVQVVKFTIPVFWYMTLPHWVTGS
jgi:hypothetical protein